ncbi:MAG: hypothetical protein JW892_00310 [Anaerolineae bacterium]|nr:hypothetical protein [Anaerolineae bacterium]
MTSMTMLSMRTIDWALSRFRFLRVVLVLSVVFGGLLRLSAPSLAQADEGLDHEYTYGQTARFTLTLPAGADISDLQFFIRIPRPSLSDTDIYSLAINEGLAVYERDLRLNPFPPFAKLTYWWTYSDTAGVAHQVGPKTFLYEDNRFAWQELREGAFTIRWVAGSSEQLVPALDIAREATDRIMSQLDSTDPGEVTFYVYPSMVDLQAALRLTGNEWVAGMALPEVGVILLAVPPTEAAAMQLQVDIPHELTHQILYRDLGDLGYAALPTWLVEGLAMVFEQRVQALRATLLEQAQQEGRLLPLADLCAPFYALDTEKLQLAYAESYSAVTYLVEVYGWSGVRELLKSYADGRECSAGIKHALGIDLPVFERQWRTWLEQDGRVIGGAQQFWAAVSLVLRDLAPWLMLAGLLILPGALAALGRRASKSELSV